MNTDAECLEQLLSELVPIVDVLKTSWPRSFLMAANGGEQPPRVSPSHRPVPWFAIVNANNDWCRTRAGPGLQLR